MLGFSSFFRLRASVLLTGLVASMLLVTAVFAATEDVIYMSDGRELHGEIVSETDTTIVFEYMNPDLGISVPLTLVKSMILKIDRDVEVDAPVEPEAAPAASGTSSSSSSSTSKASAATPRERGEVASLYIIPMNGEIGTDIRSGIYEDIIEEIRETQPDIVIYHIDSKNTEDDMLSFWLGFTGDKDEWWKPDEFQRQESIQQLMDDEEKTVFNFHRQLPSSVRQVAWVRDATGPAALLALSNEDMFMHSEGSIGALGEIWAGTQYKDDDIRSKMEKAWLGAAKSMMRLGGHSDELCEGLLRPRSPLSFSCKGRKPVWYNNTNEGDIPITPDWGFGAEITDVVRNGVPFGYQFTARPLEDLLISDGTADTLDDLALLLSLREYEVVESSNIDEVVEYRDAWRESFKAADKSAMDFYKFRNLGSLPDLQKAKKALQRLMSRVRNDESVALRIQSKYGLTLIRMEIMLEQLEAQIRQMARGGRGGGGGRGGAGGRGGGGGGGG